MIINSIVGGGGVDASGLTASTADVLKDKTFIGSDGQISTGSLDLYNVTIVRDSDSGQNKRWYSLSNSGSSELLIPLPKTVTTLPNFINLLYIFDVGSFDDLSNLIPSDGGLDDNFLISLSMGATSSLKDQYWYFVTGIGPGFANFANKMNAISEGTIGFPEIITYLDDTNNYLGINMSSDFANTGYGTLLLPTENLEIQAKAYLYFY